MTRADTNVSTDTVGGKTPTTNEMVNKMADMGGQSAGEPFPMLLLARDRVQAAEEHHRDTTRLPPWGAMIMDVGSIRPLERRKICVLIAVLPCSKQRRNGITSTER